MKCTTCNGHGYYKQKNAQGIYMDITCTSCSGSGEVSWNFSIIKWIYFINIFLLPYGILTSDKHSLNFMIALGALTIAQILVTIYKFEKEIE